MCESAEKFEILFLFLFFRNFCNSRISKNFLEFANFEIFEEFSGIFQEYSRICEQFFCKNVLEFSILKRILREFSKHFKYFSIQVSFATLHSLCFGNQFFTTLISHIRKILEFSALSHIELREISSKVFIFSYFSAL